MNRLDPDLIRILQESELSRDMKLQVIDIVSFAKDDSYVASFIEMLKAWDEADDRIEASFLEHMKSTKDNYVDQQNEIEERLQEGFEDIERTVEETEEIENLKKSVK